MSPELILMTDVNGLGTEGTTVNVSNGYARNYLIPKKLAVPINHAAMKRLEKNRLKRKEHQKNELEEAQVLADSIEKISCTIPVKVGENEKLFGSVTAGDIAEAFKKQGIKLDKHKIQLDQAIRELGVYTVKIKLLPEIEASLKVWFVGE